MKKFIIGGGTGFVGTHLIELLKSKGYGVTVVSRKPGPERVLWEELVVNGFPAGTSGVVNLAGQNILDPMKRWTPEFKQTVWKSRINTTKTLAQACVTSQHKPEVFVSISGVGIYNPSTTEEYDEESAVKEHDFLSGLCLAWEGAAKNTDEVVRTVILRSGVVLGKDGGMIKQLWLPFSMGLGGHLGKGDQYLPWIHVDDLVTLILFAIENKEVKGVLNGVAPDVITNKDFTTAFAKALNRPPLLPVPAFILNTILNPERAKLITEGQKVLPKRTLETGFLFKYPKLQDAIQEIVNKK